jgi:hypothetical protein
VARLREAGALSGGAALAEGRFGPALIEAALDCAVDVPRERARFLVPDREQSRLAAGEVEKLVGLTLAGPSMGAEMEAAVEREIALRREDLGA